MQTHVHLKCHICGKQTTNMRSLKVHLKKHPEQEVLQSPTDLEQPQTINAIMASVK